MSMKLYSFKHVPFANKYLLLEGKAYLDGINVVINGIDCHLEDSVGNIIGCAKNRFPYQWLTDLPFAKRQVDQGTNVSESDSAQITDSKVNLWLNRFCHLGAPSLSNLRNQDMVLGLDLHSGDLSKHVSEGGLCDSCELGRMVAAPRSLLAQVWLKS
jgi:hypothetical protein